MSITTTKKYSLINNIMDDLARTPFRRKAAVCLNLKEMEKLNI